MDLANLYPVIQTLERNNINYALGGSAVLYFLNIQHEVNDWDILVDCSKDKLLHSIGSFDWTEGGSGDYPFASKFRIGLPSKKIEIIGQFGIHTTLGIFQLPLTAGNYADGIQLSCPEVWIVAYHLLQRESKAKLLFDFLMENPNKINRDLVMELIKNESLHTDIKGSLRRLIQL